MSTREKLAALYAFMSPVRRRHLALTVGLMVVGAIAELVTIGAVVPFLAVVADTDDGWGLSPAAATALLASAAIVAAAVRLTLVRVSQGFALTFGHEIATRIFGRMLRHPYAHYSDQHSSELIAGFEKVQLVVYRVLLPAVQGFIATVMGACIVVLLFVLDPVAAAIATVSMGGIYVAVSFVARRHLHAASAVLSGTMTMRTRTVQEALGGIRDILLERSHGVFEDEFRSLSLRHRDASALNMWVGQAPRYVVEAAGIVVIGLLALYTSSRPGGLEEALPSLAALALGAQRLLPLVQTAYMSWSQATGNVALLADVIGLLGEPGAEDGLAATARAEPIPFERAIRFEGVTFRYARGDEALRGVDLEIPKGARVGIDGPSGSGKSTLIDLLLGLLDPAEGVVRVDDRPVDEATRAGWQAHVGHVPQALHLASVSIARNIAFGVPEDEVDLERVRRAAAGAQLDRFIATLPDGYDTVVGERGARLSGGQRQRIGIARALYKNADVLVLDEATDGLDPATERAVLDAIAALGREITVVMVAHRASALVDCDVVVRLEDGRVVESRVTA